MPAGTYNLTIEQGADLDITFTWKDDNGVAIDLTGYSARAQIRQAVDSVTTLLSVTNSDGLTLGGTAGTIRMQRTAVQTAALVWPANAVWDLEVVSAGGIVTRLLEGEAILKREVTR